MACLTQHWRDVTNAMRASDERETSVRHTWGGVDHRTARVSYVGFTTEFNKATGHRPKADVAEGAVTRDRRDANAVATRSWIELVDVASWISLVNRNYFSMAARCEHASETSSKSSKKNVAFLKRSAKTRSGNTKCCRS